MSRFRVEFYESLYARTDVLFELTDAVLCTDGPVNTLVELSLAHEMRRGHGALYAALDKGWCEPARMRRVLVDLPPAPCHRHVHGRRTDRSCDHLIPGWPYSFVAALESGRTSWCGLLDAVRPGAADDATTVTAAQLRDIVTRIIAAGHWSSGDPDMLIVMDAGYDSAYLSPRPGQPAPAASRSPTPAIRRYPAVPPPEDRQPGEALHEKLHELHRIRRSRRPLPGHWALQRPVDRRFGNREDGLHHLRRVLLRQLFSERGRHDDYWVDLDGFTP